MEAIHYGNGITTPSLHKCGIHLSSECTRQKKRQKIGQPVGPSGKCVKEIFEGKCAFFVRNIGGAAPDS